MTNPRKRSAEDVMADFEHEQWAHWTRYFLDNRTSKNIKRWTKQAHTSYADLSKQEKDKDREWAKMLSLALSKAGYVIVPVEPTEEMIAAAMKAPVYGDEGGYEISFCLEYDNQGENVIESAWQAMIDSVLKEKQ